MSEGRWGPGEDAERRRLAVALRQSEDELRTMFELAPVGIVQTDIRTRRYSRVNESVCTMLGYTAEELCALPIAAFTHPDDREQDRRMFAAVAAGEIDRARIEKRYIRKDGRVVWCVIDFRALRDEEGGCTHTLAIIEDETERRAAREALELQTTALQAAKNAIVITDTSGKVEWANHALAELTGYPLPEVLGQTLGFLKSGLQDDAFYRDLWQTILAGRAWRGQLVNRRKDGSLYDEEMTITPVHDAAGTVRHFIAMKEDVTAHRRHEAGLAASAEALRASEDRYRALVDNLDDVVFSADIDGRLTFVSRSISRFGYRPSDVVGRSIDEFVHPEDLAAMRRDFAARLAGATHDPMGLRWLDASRKVRFLRASTRPLVVDGATVGLTGLITDVTHQRETEDQLRAAQRMEAIGRLAGGVAHDFNNILVVILSYVELAIADLREEDPLRADLCEVLSAAKRAAGLTRQLLAFSRRQVLEPETVALGSLIDGLSSMLRRLIGEDVELAVAAEDEPFTARVDRGQIEQVLMNLAVNARDAMPDGGRLSIRSAKAQLDLAEAVALEVPLGDYVELTVTDTGCGMDDCVRARIFEPFFTTKAVGRGTGLGLSMVHGIVKQSGGGIAVETAPGKGTSFRVLLPRYVEDRAVVASIAPSAVQRESRGREQILLVEDEAALRNVVRRMLSSAGYDVVAAASPGEALVHCEGRGRGRGFDLVLTDVVMPGMSGRELAERLARLCPAAKVMFMSGYTDEMIEHHGVLGGRFLRKPFDREALTRKVRSVLDEVPA